MNTATVQQGFEALGIPEHSWRLVALLPLVEVAWADGEVQSMERRMILGIAQRRGLVDEAGLERLKGWLTDRPDAAYFARARQLLKSLSTQGAASDEGDLLSEIVGFCQGVAEAAGGAIGEGAVSHGEREAIQEIAQTLGVEDSTAWARMRRTFRQ